METNEELHKVIENLILTVKSESEKLLDKSNNGKQTQVDFNIFDNSVRILNSLAMSNSFLNVDKKLQIIESEIELQEAIRNYILVLKAESDRFLAVANNDETTFEELINFEQNTKTLKILASSNKILKENTK